MRYFYINIIIISHTNRIINIVMMFRCWSWMNIFQRRWLHQFDDIRLQWCMEFIHGRECSHVCKVRRECWRFSAQSGTNNEFMILFYICFISVGRLFACLCVCPALYIRLSVYMSVLTCLYVYMSLYLSICNSACLSAVKLIVPLYK